MVENSIISEIKARIYACNHSLFGYQNEKSQLIQIIERTAVKGESNSLLIIGRRGCGKTMLVNTVLEEISAKKGVCNNLLQVHLNGLLQTDDRTALKEITRQLNLEAQVGDKVFNSFAENLRYLLTVLRTGNKTQKSVLFILEEFDLFAQHHNQTLLYNLFDIAQSDHTPVCVVGLSARHDVVELLEKRVKSRFSHRQYHLCRPVSQFEDYVEIIVALLKLPNKLKDHNRTLWNKHIHDLVQDPIVVKCLERLFDFNTGIQALKSLLVLPISRMDPSYPRLSANDFEDSLQLIRQDSKSNILRGLSILELCLLTAVVKLNGEYDGEAINFELIYDKYSQFCKTFCVIQNAKPVVLKALDQLLSMGLISTSGGATVSLGRQYSGVHDAQLLPTYRPLFCQIDDHQLINCLNNLDSCPTHLKQWAANTINFT